MPSPSPPHPLRIGRYEILRKLARGGMAELYLARSVGVEGFQKPVALKRMRPELADKPDEVRLFLDEARLMARFQHPNLVHAYDVVAQDGQYFFVMEFVQGKDLADIYQAAQQQAEAIPLDVVLGIMIDVAEGLQYAHDLADEHGQPMHVVHRDISPSNVLVSRNGHVKLIDFGIAKSTARTGDKTITGVVKGKVRYMSPEQCRGEPLDRRSDVFALGVILWELTVGRRLYPKVQPAAVISTVLFDPVPRPSSIHPGFPEELEALIMRALEKERDARYPDARSLQINLAAYAQQSGLTTLPHPRSAFLDRLFPAESTAALSEAVFAAHPTQAFVVEEGSLSYSIVASTNAEPIHEVDFTDEDVAATAEADPTKRPKTRPPAWVYAAVVGLLGLTAFAIGLWTSDPATPAHATSSESLPSVDAGPPEAPPAAEAPTNTETPPTAETPTPEASPTAESQASPALQPGPARPLKKSKKRRRPRPKSRRVKNADPAESWDPDSVSL